MRYKIIPFKTEFLLVDGLSEIQVGDHYYTSLEHDEPTITQCEVIDKSKEYWLDNKYKYTFYNMDDALTSSYGSAKIVGCTAKIENDPSIPQLDINEVFDLGEISPSGVFCELDWFTMFK